MKTYLCNAFSINMLAATGQSIEFEPITASKAVAILADDWESAIGHADTATVVADELGIDVDAVRINVELRERATQLIVAQLTGGRLPEGTTTLPDGFTIQYWHVCHGYQ